jgi:hypothetical protein
MKNGLWNKIVNFFEVPASKYEGGFGTPLWGTEGRGRWTNINIYFYL